MALEIKVQEYTGKADCRYHAAHVQKILYYCMYMRDREKERERGEWMRMEIIKQQSK